MGLGATPDAEFDTRCQLIRSVPYLIQGVGGLGGNMGGAEPLSRRFSFRPGFP